MVILIYIQNVPLGRHQMVALYRVIECVRTQGAVRHTAHLIYIQNVPFGRRALCRKQASISPIVSLCVLAQTWCNLLVSHVIPNTQTGYDTQQDRTRQNETRRGWFNETRTILTKWQFHIGKIKTTLKTRQDKTRRDETRQDNSMNQGQTDETRRWNTLEA